MSHIKALKAFANVYRAAEDAGRPGESVSHKGWHAGARVGAGGDRGALLAYRRSGLEAECLFHPGRETQSARVGKWCRPISWRTRSPRRLKHYDFSDD